MVLGEGLEPSRLTAPEPKSGVSANFTTRADGAFHLEHALYKAFLKWWPDPESNWGHKDFQSSALPTELSGHT
jgi:hypothetical protein